MNLSRVKASSLRHGDRVVLISADPDAQPGCIAREVRRVSRTDPEYIMIRLEGEEALHAYSQGVYAWRVNE